MGTLTVKGTLDIAQFWPTGKSDADTSKILLTVDPASMVYRKTPGAAGKNVFNLYNAAFMDKALKKPVVKKGAITVRMQGIDAPELHYRPQTEKALGSLAKAKNNGVQVVFDYRQAQAETATARLAAQLKKLSNKPAIPCTFVTLVDDQAGPADAVDKYGRFVGDIFVGTKNINHLILEQGLAVAAMYNSLQNNEIRDYLTAAAAGKNKGVARRYSKAVLGFDPTSVFRDPKKGAQAVNEGNARYILPKLYRRQTTWFAYHKLGKFPKDFEAFLHTKDGSDRLYELNDFLDNGNAAIQKPFSQSVPGGAQVVPKPGDMIFVEAPGALFSKQGSQVKKITSWP